MIITNIIIAKTVGTMIILITNKVRTMASLEGNHNNNNTDDDDDDHHHHHLDPDDKHEPETIFLAPKPYTLNPNIDLGCSCSAYPGRLFPSLSLMEAGRPTRLGLSKAVVGSKVGSYVGKGR